MTRRRALDWVLIVLLTASWGVLFARAVADGLRTQRGRVLIGVASAASPDAYPSVRPTLWEPSQVMPGDQLTAVDGESMRGSSGLRVCDRATRAALERGFTDIMLTRAGAPFVLRLGLTPQPSWWLGLLYSAGMFLAGLTLIVRAPQWHLARRNFVAMWCFAIPGLANPTFVHAGLATDLTLTFAAYAVGSVVAIWNAQDFTLSARPVPALQRIFALPAGILFVATYLARYFLPSLRITTGRLMFAAVACLAVGMIAGLIRAYRRAAPLGRRQMRWLVLGIYVALVGAVLSEFSALDLFAGMTRSATALGASVIQALSGLAIPVGMTISVLGYRWLDIDRLISAAASYTIVGDRRSGRCARAGAATRERGCARPRRRTGRRRWLLTMALVLAAIPAHLYLRPRIDRGLFAERHRRISGLAQLVDEVGRCSGADELWALTSERIDALLGPESLVAYAREGKVFAPRFVRGAANPPPYDADSLLVRALERRGMPLAADASELDPFDRAALETLGVALVMPIGTHESLLGFACLGRKGSHDIYTREETAQLAAVALRCAQVLRPDAERPPTLPNVFRREGELWTVASRGKQIHLRDMRGLHYLATLLREPGREFAVLDLVRTASGPAPVGNSPSDPELRVGRRLGDAGPVLDLQARNEYRARLAELGAELADAERCADLGRLERASAEREALLAELESSDRGAKPGSDAERARVAVTKAIRTALEKITEGHPELGAHLAGSIHRGLTCAYKPDPRDPAEWEV